MCFIWLVFEWITQFHMFCLFASVASLFAFQEHILCAIKFHVKPTTWQVLIFLQLYCHGWRLANLENWRAVHWRIFISFVLWNLLWIVQLLSVGVSRSVSFHAAAADSTTSCYPRTLQAWNWLYVSVLCFMSNIWSFRCCDNCLIKYQSRWPKKEKNSEFSRAINLLFHMLLYKK